MSINFSVLHGGYLTDLLAQPGAVARTVSALRTQPRLPLRALACERIILTGMGSSLHALYPLQLRLIRSGRTAVMVETAELIHSQASLLDSRSLLVAVSQSGRSAETVRLLDLVDSLSSQPFTLGVTNTEDSPLARRSDAVVMMQAGPEFSVSCKTYLATLAALDWLGGALVGDDLPGLLEGLEGTAEQVQRYLDHWSDHVTQLTGDILGLHHLFLTGRGASLAAVGTGALILKESTRFHAEGMSTPAFRHGPLEMVDEGLFAMVFAGEPSTAELNRKLVGDIEDAGGRAAFVSESGEPGVFRLPAIAPRLRPLVEILPVQMLSLALAAEAGREPGRFHRATKVTVVA